MENVKVWKDDDGVVHLGVDREGERAVSQRIDPEAVIREIARVAGFNVDVTVAGPIVEPDGPAGTTDTAP